MNKKEIAQKISIHAGMDPIGPSSTVNQTGEEAKIVDWIDASYQDILEMHNDWKFLNDDFTFQLDSGEANYTPADAGLTDFKKWCEEDFRYYLTLPNENDIFHMEWDNFKRVYLFGSARTQTGPISRFTIKPDKSLLFWPIPDDDYYVTGWYYKKGAAMDGDTAEPLFDEEYHWIIAWRALLYYGADYIEADRYTHGQREYKRILRNMEFNELPPITRGNPLC
jgi:hypothetical protein